MVSSGVGRGLGKGEACACARPGAARARARWELVLAVARPVARPADLEKALSVPGEGPRALSPQRVSRLHESLCFLQALAERVRACVCCKLT